MAIEFQSEITLSFQCEYFFHVGICFFVNNKKHSIGETKIQIECDQRHFLVHISVASVANFNTIPYRYRYSFIGYSWSECNVRTKARKLNA